LRLLEEAEEAYLWEPGAGRRLASLDSSVKARALVGAAAVIAVDIGLWVTERGPQLLKPLEHISAFMLLSRRLGLSYKATLDDLEEMVLDLASRAESDGGVRLWAAGSPGREAAVAVYLLRALEPSVSQLLDSGVEAYTAGVSEASASDLLAPSYSRVCRLICMEGAIYSSMGAVFLLEGSRVISPPSLVAHEPVRSVVAELARYEGLKVVERCVTCGELYSADEVFLACSVLGIVPVRAVDGAEIGVGEAARGLQVGFLKAARGLTVFPPSWVVLARRRRL